MGLACRGTTNGCARPWRRFLNAQPEEHRGHPGQIFDGCGTPTIPKKLPTATNAAKLLLGAVFAVKFAAGSKAFGGAF